MPSNFCWKPGITYSTADPETHLSHAWRCIHFFFPAWRFALIEVNMRWGLKSGVTILPSLPWRLSIPLAIPHVLGWASSPGSASQCLCAKKLLLTARPPVSYWVSDTSVGKWRRKGIIILWRSESASILAVSMDRWCMAFTVASLPLLPIVLGLPSIPALALGRTFSFFLFSSPRNESCSRSFFLQIKLPLYKKDWGQEGGWSGCDFWHCLTLPVVPFSQLTWLGSILKSPLSLSFEHLLKFKKEKVQSPGVTHSDTNLHFNWIFLQGYKASEGVCFREATTFLCRKVGRIKWNVRWDASGSTIP